MLLNKSTTVCIYIKLEFEKVSVMDEFRQNSNKNSNNKTIVYYVVLLCITHGLAF